MDFQKVQWKSNESIKTVLKIPDLAAASGTYDRFVGEARKDLSLGKSFGG